MNELYLGWLMLKQAIVEQRKRDAKNLYYNLLPYVRALSVNPKDGGKEIK